MPPWKTEAPTVPRNDGWRARNLLISVLQTQARACWQKGKTGESLDWLLLWHRDACRSALSFYGGKTHSAGIYRFNSARGQRRFAMDEFEMLAPHLNASQMRLAARKLQENRALLPSHLEALRVTKAANLDFARQVCQSNDLRRYFDFQNPQSVEMGAAEQLRFRWANKKTGLRKLAAQWDWIIGQSQAPTPGYGQNMPESLSFDASDVFRPMQTDWSNFNSSSNEINAREVVFLTALATRAFAIENGRNPRELGELVPRYLRKVETDPFNHAKPLFYSPRPKSYVLSQRGKSIEKRPLPKNAIPSFFAPPFDQRNPAGFVQVKSIKTLPFLLYSIGNNGLDDGGLNLKAEKSGVPNGCDDVLALSRWFNSQEQERDEHLSRLSQVFNFPPPGGPPP